MKRKVNVFSPVFAPGDKVIVDHLDLEGVVIYVAYSHRGIEHPEYLIEWLSNDNEVNSRWFDEDQLSECEY